MHSSLESISRCSYEMHIGRVLIYVEIISLINLMFYFGTCKKSNDIEDSDCLVKLILWQIEIKNMLKDQGKTSMDQRINEIISLSFKSAMR